ncbi:response regulator [Neorhizobium sp. CSC1952]|uniref:response regulator n=1 Tax=Neorhizobium sp. CSC1952 TaxID=2978974 RepID=UPI0025A577C0|nr:response regulator [Rhizobium sp. CSC1952]WJR67967.1 response regulator [Rhizobium sp. CSC1952]
MNDLSSADANIQIAMLEVISEGISGGVLVYDRNDLIVFASQQLLGLLPVPKSFLAPGTRLRDFLGAVYDSGGRFSTDSAGPRRMLSREDWIAEQIATLWKERAETLERRGTDRWLSFTKRRLSSGYGVCVVRDVSDHKKREEQWRTDMERVQITEEVLDNLPFPVTVKDGNFTFVAVNKAASRFLDLPAEAVLGRKGSDIHPPELERRLDLVNRQLFQTGEPVQLLERVTGADGSEVIIIANKYRIGKPGRYYIVTAMEDITGLVEVDGGGRIVPGKPRTELISSSPGRHDRKARPEPGRDTAGVAGRKVLVVASDLQMEAEALDILGELGLDTSSVSGAGELELFLRLAYESGIRIDLVVVDVAMDLQCLEAAERHGVPALAIGSLRMRRELAAGVTRLLARPENVVETVQEEERPTEPVCETESPGIDILVAEDNEVNQIVFSQILEGFGYRYAIAADGEEAIRLWKERSPRLILMDITLPKLSGFEASARIRSLETADSSIPIIGVLAQPFDRDRDECFASGMNEVILKPISPEALEALFQTFLDMPEKRSYA